MLDIKYCPTFGTFTIYNQSTGLVQNYMAQSISIEPVYMHKIGPYRVRNKIFCSLWYKDVSIKPIFQHFEIDLPYPKNNMAIQYGTSSRDHIIKNTKIL